ncbi:MAG: hypothetical protein LBC74_12890, partial [Planctomycetaceae bacterium]|nr:hypothetical protein [Planctomycetaceae bacterium]
MGRDPFWQKESFKKLVSADPIVVTPILMEVKRNYYNVHNNIPINAALAEVLNSVCKIDGWPHFDPWCGEPLYISWYGGSERYKNRFILLYNLLVKARETKDEKKIEMINEALRSQGIFMLTFLMEKIIDGDNLLFPVVQKMFDRYGNELKGKSKDEILVWWEKNKKRYQLPPQNKEKFNNVPVYLFGLTNESTIEEKVDKFYHGTIGWEGRHIIQGVALGQRERSRKFIELGKLIGIENTPQFRFLVDLGKEALPYLFLKLRDE